MNQSAYIIPKTKICENCGFLMKLKEFDNFKGTIIRKNPSDMFYSCTNCTLAIRVPMQKKNKKLEGWF